MFKRIISLLSIILVMTLALLLETGTALATSNAVVWSKSSELGIEVEYSNREESLKATCKDKHGNLYDCARAR